MSSDGDRIDELRKQAQARLEEEEVDTSLNDEDQAALVHELQTHQIELEIQNEQLRETQEKLEQARDEYSDLFDFAPVGYVTLDERGIIQRANLTMSTMLQMERRILQNKPLSAVVTEQSQNEYFHFLRDLPAIGQQGVELDFVRADGTTFTGHVTSVQHRTGEPIYLLAVTDITEKAAARRLLQETNTRLEARVAAQTEELREALKQAKQANELKVKFLGMVSHELRTPLTSVLGFASTLLAEDVDWDADSSQEFVQIIHDEAEKLNELVGQLLDLSRLEAGRLHIKLAPGRLQDVLDVAHAQLEMLAVDHTLDIEVPDSLPKVIVDRKRVAQVLTNLVDNAAKYSPAGTQVTIDAEKVDGFVRVDVSDEGPGIPPATRAYI